MIIFEKIRFKNFLSIGDAFYEIDLQSYRSTLTVGHNGSGKSIMLDALSYVLFGKAHRDINITQLVNSINNKGCLCEVEFSIGKNAYRVIRGMKPNIFEIWENDILINQESHNRDYQKLLETNIIKLNHKSFHQVVVLGAGNFVPFMKLPAYHRRAVIEDLLDISIFSKMNVLMKDNLSKIKESIKDHDREIEALKGKIELHKRHIEKIQAIDINNSAQYDTEIADLNESIKSLEEECDTLISNNVLQPDVVKKKQSLVNRLTKLQAYNHQIDLNTQQAKKDRSFYDVNLCCPVCAQDIVESFRQGKIAECNHKITELEEGKRGLELSISESNTKVKELEETIKQYERCVSQVQLKRATIKTYSDRIKSINDRKNSDQLVDVNSELLELERLRKTRDDSITRREEFHLEKEYFDVIYDMLKDSGIKTKIIQQYLPVMNNLINHYLQVLDFFVSFELDENFKESILSRHRDKFSYASFSEGEKTRIDLALLFAWREISKMKNSTNTNLLILDEIFDSSLDSDGVDNLLKIMGSLDESTRLFVITHKPESFEECFDRKITADKKGNFTTYRTDILK